MTIATEQLTDIFAGKVARISGADAVRLHDIVKVAQGLRGVAGRLRGIMVELPEEAGRGGLSSGR
ncbi:MAG TPA: hypothetical protein VF432_31105 [Thermoanaerobaculia bacterium]